MIPLKALKPNVEPARTYEAAWTEYNVATEPPCRVRVWHVTREVEVDVFERKTDLYDGLLHEPLTTVETGLPRVRLYDAIRICAANAIKEIQAA
jgi:hypothetical protein